jgi:enolase
MHEAVELRDGGSVLSGKDVQKALHNIQHEIARRLSVRISTIRN